MGRCYANGRNHTHGPGRHTAVSVLSPYIRHQLLTEAEVVATALQAHGPQDAENFFDEVMWRGQFKGWLDRRPQVWTQFTKGLQADLATMERNRRLRRDLDRAMQGQTDPDCCDAWVE